ncbi:MAG: tetratricopeptide repeat protein [Desulfobacteraceae bacterium]|nr:tetratricopeptide repeat protein [Desulfobacteraceae bacterium]
MAEQGVSNERRKELEQIDPFQENLLRTLVLLKKNKKQFLLILGAIIGVIVIFSGIMFSFKKSENLASDLVAKAVITYGKANDPIKGFDATKDDFEAVFTDYSNTSAGRMGRVKFAKICFDAGEYDRAFELYQEALEIFKNEAGMKNFILASLGHVSQARNEVDKAKSYFLQIETGPSDLLKDEARFALAGIYEASNDMESSLKMYEKIVNDHENSIYRSIAESKIKEVK